MREFLHSFTKLEYDKVKKHIQQFTISSIGSELIEQLVPTSSVDDIKSSLSLVSEMKRLLEEHDYPPLNNVPDVRVSLQRTSIENFILPAEELYKIKLILQNSYGLNNYFKNKNTTKNPTKLIVLLLYVKPNDTQFPTLTIVLVAIIIAAIKVRIPTDFLRMPSR